MGKRTLLGMEQEKHQLSDAELLESAIAGNSESFGLIFDRHHRRVLMQARRHVGSAVEAEDITAMVFLEAWRLKSRIRIVNNSVVAWLLVTTNNIARNASRANRRYGAFLAKLPDAFTGELVDPTLGEVQLRQDREELRAAFALLDRKDQDVLTLCVLEQLTTNQAAQVLRVPIGTVKSRLSRAKRKLADLVPHLRMHIALIEEAQ